MDPHDEQTERYLKEFRPKAIRELQVPPRSKPILWRRWAAVAALAACAGGIFWFSFRESTLREGAANTQALKTVVAGQQQHLSTIALTSLALQDEKKFDALLEEESRKSLPRLQGEHSSLKVLAKD
jgi:hypothetical protein